MTKTIHGFAHQHFHSTFLFSDCRYWSLNEVRDFLFFILHYYRKQFPFIKLASSSVGMANWYDSILLTVTLSICKFISLVRMQKKKIKVHVRMKSILNRPFHPLQPILYNNGIKLNWKFTQTALWNVHMCRIILLEFRFDFQQFKLYRLEDKQNCQQKNCVTE